jgi:AcrR family transcriptional regulator
LARDLGITQAEFYRHFRDRRGLLQAILDDWTHEFNAVITEISE